MKKITFFIFIVIWSNGLAQKGFKATSKLGAKIGVVSANMQGGRVKSGSRIVFEGGIWCQIKLSKKWTGQAELMYVEKGTDFTSKGSARSGDYAVSIMYIECPILFQYHIKNFILEGGPGAGVLFFQKETLAGAPSPDLTNSYPFNKSELSFNIGCGYSLNNKWLLGLRFTHSVLPIRKQIPDIPKQVYSRVFAIAFSRNFTTGKEKKSEASSIE